MPTTRASGRSNYAPTHTLVSSEGVAYFTNGIDLPRRWNGRTASVEEAGLEAPTTAPTVGSSGSGTINGDFIAYCRFIDANGQPSSLSPVALLTATSDGQVDYTNVPVSTNSRVVARQLFRSSSGQSTVVYLDQTISDNITTTATGVKTDTQLQASEALPILDSDGAVFANRFDPLSSFYSVVTEHRGRLYAAVVVPYSQGSIEATNGSATITGIGTAWTSAFEGRELHVAGVGVFTIDEVASATSLTILGTYSGTTSKFIEYSIEPPRAYRNAVAYTFSGESESWSALYLVTTAEDGGAIRALYQQASFLYFAKETMTYKFTVQNDPALDGVVYKAFDRGAINQRCYVNTDDGSIIMDRAGIYSSNGAAVTPISDSIQDYFRGDRINWSAQRWFHASYSQSERVVRFFVATTGSRYPLTALCFHLDKQAWWVEEHSQRIASSTQAVLGGLIQTVYGGEFGSAHVQQGSLDLWADDGSTRRGTVTSASATTLSDSSATFGSGQVNAPVAIVSGTGKGQSRRITAASGTKLTLRTPWLIQPDESSVYQVGGFPWSWKSGQVMYPTVDATNRRAVRVLARPTENDATLDVLVYPNFESGPQEWGEFRQNNEEGVTISPNADHAVIDLKRIREGQRGATSGMYRFTFDDTARDWEPTERHMAIKLQGYSAEDQLKIHSLAIEGAAK